MIFTFTDFGVKGPYMGQMRAALLAAAPDTDVIDLMVDAPPFDPRASAYLLAAVSQALPASFVCVAVIDPGVGSARRPLILRCGGRLYVGPDNGLLEIVARHAAPLPGEWWEITWQPENLSASFHGRDLFAPVAGRLAMHGEVVLPELAKPFQPEASVYSAWSDDLAEVIYIDAYGNCMTGVRTETAGALFEVVLDSLVIPSATTFSAVQAGQAFCYGNAMGLLEIAVNQGSAASSLGLEIGSQVAVRNVSGK